MATIKLNKPAAAAPDAPRSEARRAPLRGSGNGVQTRPTLAQAQAQRAEREAQYQEQLRQRFGDRPPPQALRRDAEPQRPPARGRSVDPQRAPRGRDAPPTGQPAQRFDARRPASPPTERQRQPEAQARPQPQRFDDRAPSRSRPSAPAAAGGRSTAFDGPRPRTAPPAPRGPQGPAAAPPMRADRRAPRRSVDRDDDDDDWQAPAEHPPGSMRLSKRMSELGIASRREADEWIAKGWVRVDDQIVGTLGARVMPGQRVTVDAKAKFQQAQRVTVLMNKPVGYVSGQAEDGYEPAFVLVTPDRLWSEDRSGTRYLREHLKSLVPAGRLDIDSVGLLVLTQDGRVAKQLIGEDSEMEKEYLVRVATLSGQHLPEASLALLRHGLELDGEALKPATVEWVNDDQLRFVLTQGKKRQIRRMCEAVGLQVLGLKRVRIGAVMLGDLPTGQWRYLRADESFE